jgi:hypothetical protein
MAALTWYKGCDVDKTEEQEREEKAVTGDEVPVKKQKGTCNATPQMYLQHDSSVDMSGNLVHGPCHRSCVKAHNKHTTFHWRTHHGTRVMMSCDPGTADWGVSIMNKMLYAKLHGDDLWVVAYEALGPEDHTPRPPIWTKAAA